MYTCHFTHKHRHRHTHTHPHISVDTHIVAKLMGDVNPSVDRRSQVRIFTQYVYTFFSNVRMHAYYFTETTKSSPNTVHAHTLLYIHIHGLYDSG